MTTTRIFREVSLTADDWSLLLQLHKSLLKHMTPEQQEFAIKIAKQATAAHVDRMYNLHQKVDALRQANEALANTLQKAAKPSKPKTTWDKILRFAGLRK